MIDFYIYGAVTACLLARRALHGTQQRFARTSIAVMGAGVACSLVSPELGTALLGGGMLLACAMAAVELSWGVRRTLHLLAEARG